MGCSQQYISKILKGQENLSIETIYKIEEALEIEMNPIFFAGIEPISQMAMCSEDNLDT